MAYRCLESWTAGDGNTYQLAQINDFSIIPTDIIDATTMSWHIGELENSCPSYVTDLGDLIFDLQSSINADVTLNFVDNDIIRILLGRYNMNDTGSRMSGDQWKDIANNRFFKQGGWANFSSGKIKFYIAVVIDTENERAYVCSINHQYYHFNNVVGWMVHVLGGKPNDVDLFFEVFGEHLPKYASNGGGATHIAKVTGQLKDLSSNLSDILMVSGGGGGGLLSGDTDYSGKEAGGISGSGDNSADQSTGNAFGQGESGTNVSGGGSGLYGGYKGTSSKSGGAGSGYIGNSLLSNKKMVGYNVPTSSAESTKTESINEVSASAVSGKPKSGNGFARIKFLSSEVFSADAQNQLKDSVRNVIPAVASGTNGTYDSSTQSYVFNSGCYLGYNSVVTKEQLQALTKIIFESNVKVNSGVVGNDYDTEVFLSNSLSGTAGSNIIITAKICNGSYDQAANTHLAILNYGNYKWQGNAPEDVPANQGSFHNVKHKFSLSNGTVTKIEVYLDNVLFAEISPNVQLTLNDDAYYFCVGACDKTSIKNTKVVFE